MIIKKAVEQVIESGVKPIILELQQIKNHAQETEVLRTSLTIRSLSLGVLTPHQYRFVARRTSQGNRLVQRNIERLFYFYDELKREFPTVKLYTVSAYARTLQNGEFRNVLYETLLKYPQVEKEKICIELSADLLFEDLDEYKGELKALRELGVKIALCEVGEEFCPMLRLNEIEFDVAFLDQYVNEQQSKAHGEDIIKSLVDFIHLRPIKVYAGNVTNEEESQLLEKLGCDGYAMKEDSELEHKEWRLGGKAE